MDTILFLCPHNAAKGILAEAYFNQRARQAGLAWQADSAGTEPADTIWPSVIALLEQAGIPVRVRPPRLVTPGDLQAAGQVISLGCALEELPAHPAQFTTWVDVPLASVDLPGAWQAIQRYVDQVVAALAHGQAEC